MKTTAKALMKNASKITGGQVRVTEWNTLLSMIPSLMNTTEGQIAISDTRKIFNNMVAARAQIERDVKDENGGLKPKNFDTLVEKRYKPIQTEMSQQLTNRIKQATWIAGTEMDHLPDPKTVPAGKGIIDDKGRRLKVVNGEWKEIK
jgi:ABC-type antimicrobial peptide transport system ATPase subunit